jgi:hypothetical protein
LIEFRPSKINNFLALQADKVLVDFGVGIEPAVIVERVNARNNPALLEQSQGTVDGIQGDHRHPFFNTPVDIFGGGMIVGYGDFPIDFQPLMSDFDSTIPAGCIESF